MIGEGPPHDRRDLGNYLMAGIPNGRVHRSTGTPVTRPHTARERSRLSDADPDGTRTNTPYAESIEDGTTLPLYYTSPQRDARQPGADGEEFWSVAETEGITDIEGAEQDLDRAVNLKNFLKGDERVDKIAKYCGRALREERRAPGL